MTIGINLFTQQSSYIKQSTGFGVNFKPNSKEEELLEDMHTMQELFKKASKGGKENQGIRIWTIESGLFSRSIWDCPELECFPKNEVKRVFTKIRKNPEYGEMLLDKTIENLQDLPQNKIAVVLAKYAKNIIRHPDYKEAIGINDQIHKIWILNRTKLTSIDSSDIKGTFYKLTSNICRDARNLTKLSYNYSDYARTLLETK